MFKSNTNVAENNLVNKIEYNVEPYQQNNFLKRFSDVPITEKYTSLIKNQELNEANKNRIIDIAENWVYENPNQRVANQQLITEQLNPLLQRQKQEGEGIYNMSRQSQLNSIDEKIKILQNDSEAIKNNIEIGNEKFIENVNNKLKENPNYINELAEQKKQIEEGIAKYGDEYFGNLSDPNFKNLTEAEKNIESLKIKAKKEAIQSEIENIRSKAQNVKLHPEFEKKIKDLFTYGGGEAPLSIGDKFPIERGMRERNKIIYPRAIPESVSDLSPHKQKSIIETQKTALGVNEGLTGNTYTFGENNYNFDEIQGVYNITHKKEPFKILEPSTWLGKKTSSTVSKTPSEIIKTTKIRDADPEQVFGTIAHEVGHDIQKFGDFGDLITAYDSKLGYRTNHGENELSQLFKKHMVEPSASDEMSAWLSSANELHSDLVAERIKIINKLDKDPKKAVEMFRANEDKYIDDILESGELNKFFKSGTPINTKKTLIKILPAITPIAGTSYLATQGQGNEEQAPQYQQGGNFTEAELAFLSEIAIKDSEGYRNPTNKNKIVEINSPSISMKGIKQPIMAISKQTGEKKKLNPEQEYVFNNTQQVIEIPFFKAQQGDKIQFDYVNYGTPEYEKAYREGRFAHAINQLDEVVLVGSRKNIPNIDDKIQLREGIENVKKEIPSLKEDLITKKSLDKVKNITEEKALEIAKNTKSKPFITNEEEQDKIVNKLIKEREGAYNSRSNELDPLPEFDEVIDLTKLGSKEEVLKVQKELKRLGYNLNPDGKFKDDGLDGIMGKVTKQAIEEHNTKQNRGVYSSIKGDKEGLLGKCKEEQCSEYAQNELFRNFKPNVPRKAWNELTGLQGDAWRIGNNIIKAGGVKVEEGKVSPGDAITMFTGGSSPYLSEARKHGTDATHIGIVDKVNPDGSYYILHNSHAGNGVTGYEGREYRDLVKDGKIVSGGLKRSYEIRGVYRPNYSKVKDFEEKNKLRQDIVIKFNESKKDELKAMNKDNYFGSTVEEKVPVFLGALNNQTTKKNIASKHNLTETEYQSLSKLVLGLLAQESKLGTSDKAPVKEAAARVSKIVGNMIPGVDILNDLTGKTIIKRDEVSAGAGQVKYRTNFGNADLTEVGINSSNFSEDKNIPIVVLDIIANHYKELKKKGETSEAAMYKAVEKYNRGSNTKYADEKDSDYVNKVINYTELFEVEDKQGKKYNTLADKLLLEKNIAKKKVLAKS